MWPTLQLFFVLSLLLNWHSWQLDFTMAFPQAPVEVPLYMNIPKGYKGAHKTKLSHVLKLLHSIYGQKQGLQVWNKFLEQG